MMATQRVGSAALSRRQVQVRAASTTTVVATPTDIRRWQALNITKANLKDSQGGEATRNIDGAIYSIRYISATDDVEVVDRTRGLRFPAAVADDNRIRINTAAAEPHALAGFSQSLYAPILAGNQPGAELVNGRAAMAAFPLLVVSELASQQGVLQQVASSAGAAAAAALAVLVLAASVAPSVAGRTPVQRVFPSPQDPYSDTQLPYYFSPLAELINGRVAMLGVAGLLATEAFRGGAALF